MSTSETLSASGQKTTVIAPREQAFEPANVQERVTYGRALDAIIWAMPIVNYDTMYQAAVRDAKTTFNELLYWTKPADQKNQTLTPNTDALYCQPFFDTKDAGPMVLEIPPVSDEGTLVGSIMDCWQIPLEDIGRAGADKGEGGKYLILPPGYTERPPAGYIVLPSDNYRGYAILRSIPQTGDAAGIAKAARHFDKIKLYPLAQAGTAETIRKDITNVQFEANIPYDLRFFESLHRMVQAEPWLERDRVMVNTLQYLGIEKEQPFTPDDRMKALLGTALTEARQWFTEYYENGFTPFFANSRWRLPVDQKLIEAIASGFHNRDSYPMDPRGVIYYFAYSGVKHLGSGQFYLVGTTDNKGNPLDGSRYYKLHVPAGVPVKQYWSATAYDYETHALIREMPYGSRSSLTPGLHTNTDGSTDIWFGPQALAGKASNWVPVKAGGRFEIMFRLYGPEQELFAPDKKWVLPDPEEIAG